ncbi:MAG: GNAT family N-acetyltransferase [Firmicutes bacterium]|nr:GNAT family N-acetyltransferase [Bacillota bacterium]
MEKTNEKVILRPLEENDRDRFIRDNQYAFRYGAMEEFGERDSHFEEDGEIISRKTIENCIDREGSEAYRIVCGGKNAGGVVIHTDKESGKGELELLFVSPDVHSKGIGYAAWQAVEAIHPEITVWETMTPYFEKRNIHFYVNRCGFHIVEFYNEFHAEPHSEEDYDVPEAGGPDEMFRFRKVIEKE